MADRGKAVPEERLPHLFESFFTTKAGGLGSAGLSIARSIVGVHHGRIVAANDPKGGAIFVVTLPLNGRALAP